MSRDETPIKTSRCLQPGQKFNRWTVLAVHGRVKIGSEYLVGYDCVCDCGSHSVKTRNHLVSGASKSCGCLRDEKSKQRATKHDLRHTRAYNTWCHMKARCDNPQNKAYKYYGGRGVTYCESWKDFENFYKDMGEAPEGLSLDRVDCNGNYCKENCRWADDQEQRINQRQLQRNKSGRTGVSFNTSKKKWCASICLSGITYYGGCYENFEDAVEARKLLEVKHHGQIRPESYETVKEYTNESN